MKRIIMTIGFMATLASPFAVASEVTEGVDTTVFNSGDAALASEVNANFSALIGAINDNAQRIAALEGAIGDGATDGTYTFVEMAVELAAHSGTALNEAYSEISTFSSGGTFTLDQAGSFSGTINENRSMLFTNLHGDCATEECEDAYDPDFANTSSEPLSGTWTEDASTVTLDLGGDTVVLHKAGPRLLVFSEKDTVTTDGEPIFDFTNIVMLIKQ